MVADDDPTFRRPELVEGLHFFLINRREKQPFDKLRANGGR